jgi:predicted dinucleotide-binding enzyme
VVDANNPILSDGTYVNLGAKTSSELVAAQLPGARVVKAFNSLFVAWMEDEPGQPAGKRVVFVSGDEAEAKHTVKGLISAMGFAPSTWVGWWREAGSNKPASPWPRLIYC